MLEKRLKPALKAKYDAAAAANPPSSVGAGGGDADCGDDPFGGLRLPDVPTTVVVPAGTPLLPIENAGMYVCV